jgi:hypothetical protein
MLQRIIREDISSPLAVEEYSLRELLEARESFWEAMWLRCKSRWAFFSPTGIPARRFHGYGRPADAALVCTGR